MDRVDQATRSRMMAGIRSRDTKPELAVRSTAHRLGFRFRLHGTKLPGTPDLTFPKFRKVVFVHGCYWHRHSGCRFCYEPKSHVAFWQRKFARNVARDAEVQSRLEEAGWDPLVIWECETRDPTRIAEKLTTHLGPPTPQ